MTGGSGRLAAVSEYAAAVTIARSWGEAVADARVRAAAENRPVAVVPDQWTLTFDVVAVEALFDGDWINVALVVEPDPDLVAMLAACPVDTDAVAAFRWAVSR